MNLSRFRLRCRICHKWFRPFGKMRRGAWRAGYCYHCEMDQGLRLAAALAEAYRCEEDGANFHEECGDR